MLITLIGLASVAAAQPARADTPAAAQAKTAAVVVLGPGASAAEVVRVATALSAAGFAVLDADAISLRLRGARPECRESAARSPRAQTASALERAARAMPHAGGTPPDCHMPPDEDALAQRLDEAFALEADYQSERADALRREVIAAFHAEPRPSPRLRQLAGEASVALAASALASSGEDDATVLAADAMRHFANTPIDTMRYPPAVIQLVSTAREQVARASLVEVRVSSTGPGRLYADGNDLGLVSRELVLRLAPGSYRLWLKSEREVSLPYPIEVASAPVRVRMTPALDQAIRFDRPSAIDCEAGACVDLLEQLRVRLGVDEVVGVEGSSHRAIQVAQAVAGGGASRSLSLDAFVRESAPVLAAPLPSESPTAVATGWRAQLWREHKTAVVAGAAGVLAVAAGAFFGLQSRASFSSAGESGIAQLEHDARNDAGRREAITANVLFGVGAAALGAASVSVAFRW